MLRYLGRWIHGVSIIDKCDEEEQRTFISAIVMGLLVDGQIQLDEEINLLNFLKLINWKFDLEACVAQSKKQNVIYLEKELGISEFVDDINARITNKNVKQYLLKKFYMYFLDRVNQRMGFPNLNYYNLMKSKFLG